MLLFQKFKKYPNKIQVQSTFTSHEIVATLKNCFKVGDAMDTCGNIQHCQRTFFLTSLAN
jgi:hypothetical protein